MIKKTKIILISVLVLFSTILTCYGYDISGVWVLGAEEGEINVSEYQDFSWGKSPFISNSSGCIGVDVIGEEPRVLIGGFGSFPVTMVERLDEDKIRLVFHFTRGDFNVRLIFHRVKKDKIWIEQISEEYFKAFATGKDKIYLRIDKPECK
jgi:hypothetical protein